MVRGAGGSPGGSDAHLHEKYPNLKVLAGPNASKGSWVAAFRAQPDAMHSLIADMIKQAYATSGRVGQRPMPREEMVDLQGILHGETTDLPLREVLSTFMAERGMTERQFAMRLPLTRTQFRRLLSGAYMPDVKEIRAIADIVGKPAVYFIEYRKAMVLAAFVGLLDERPGVATNLYRNYLEVRA